MSAMSEVKELIDPLREAAFRKVKKKGLSRKDARHLLPIAMALFTYYGGSSSDEFYRLEEEAIKLGVSLVEIEKVVGSVKRIMSDLTVEDRTRLYLAVLEEYGDGVADNGGEHAEQEQSVAV